MDDGGNWAGKRLGLPESGPGSIAKIGRRAMALAVDWALSMLISNAFFGGDATATLTAFTVVQWLMVASLGASFGHLIFGLRVRKLDGTPVGLVAGFIRVGLILLVIPATIWDADNRGLHDKAAKTLLVLK